MLIQILTDWLNLQVISLTGLTILMCRFSYGLFLSIAGIFEHVSMKL